MSDVGPDALDVRTGVYAGSAVMSDVRPDVQAGRSESLEARPGVYTGNVVISVVGPDIQTGRPDVRSGRYTCSAEGPDVEPHETAGWPESLEARPGVYAGSVVRPDVVPDSFIENLVFGAVLHR
eukprot:828665_1